MIQMGPTLHIIFKSHYESKKCWVYFAPRVAFSSVQKQKVLEEIPLRYEVQLSFSHPLYVRETRPQHYGIQKGSITGN